MTMPDIEIRPLSETASIGRGIRCLNCGWPVVQVACNGSFQNFADARYCDFWWYCSNKACAYHHGQSVLFNDPAWVQRIEEPEE